MRKEILIAIEGHEYKELNYAPRVDYDYEDIREKLPEISLTKEQMVDIGFLINECIHNAHLFYEFDREGILGYLNNYLFHQLKPDVTDGREKLKILREFEINLLRIRKQGKAIPKDYLNFARKEE